MCTMGLRARRKVRNALDSTGMDVHRTSCFRMIHNPGANNDYPPRNRDHPCSIHQKPQHDTRAAA